MMRTVKSAYSVLQKTKEGIKGRGVLCVLLLPFVLSSCASVGPDFAGLEAPQQKEWQEDAKLRQVTDGGDNSLWWKHFNDPVLNQLIETAHKQNLSLQVAGLRVLEARARLGIATWNQFPQDVGVNGSYTNQQYSNINSDIPLAPSNNSDQISQLGLSATWEMDFWGRFRRGVEAEEASLYASYASYDDFLVILNSEIANTYVNICTYEERLRIAQKNVGLQQRSLDITQVRFRNATTTELDVRRAETLLMQTKSLIPVFELGITKYKNALAVLLGSTPDQIGTLLGDAQLLLPAAPQHIATGVPADLLRRRPDIRRAELIAASQSARIGVAKSDLFPSFYLSGAIGTIDQNIYSEGGSSDYTLAFIKPGFSWKILNFGRIQNSVRAQDARFQQSIVDYENTVLNAYREVENSLAGVTRRNEQVGFLDKSVKASSRSVDLALIQYRDGTIDYTPVIDTQARLAVDEDNLVNSRGEVLLNVVATYKALGGGWEGRMAGDVVSDETKAVMIERTYWGDVLEAPSPKPDKLPESPRAVYSLGRDE